MKILIVTIYNSLNYGAYLQGYGLYRTFKDMGHDVHMYVADPHNFKFYMHSLHLRKPQEVVYNVKLLKSFYCSWMAMKQTKNLSDMYDLAVIGSDELWNVHNVNFKHTEIYIGKGIRAKKICTYAVSGNNTTAEEFSTIYGANSLRYIDRIAVRDDYTYTLVHSLTGSKPEMVIDPTLLYTFKLPQKVLKERYIVVYGYYFEDDECHTILSYAQNLNMKLISAGFVHKWCDEIFTGTPLEFLALIHNAEGVISATFHGTILSMKYNKKLAVFHHGSQKIIDVLSRFSMLECAVSKERSIEDCFKFSTEYSDFNERLENAIVISKQYLEELLE